jgi:hypothetical protein
MFDMLVVRIELQSPQERLEKFGRICCHWRTAVLFKDRDNRVRKVEVLALVNGTTKAHFDSKTNTTDCLVRSWRCMLCIRQILVILTVA